MSFILHNTFKIAQITEKDDDFPSSEVRTEMKDNCLGKGTYTFPRKIAPRKQQPLPVN